MTRRTPLLCLALAPTLLSCFLAGCKHDGGPVDMSDPADLAVADLGRPDLGASRWACTSSTKTSSNAVTLVPHGQISW